ncbi:serine/threonine protein kinase [Catenulispora acidiphila DSM 44928]|uniref:non-specific serine/threonine protein kinase n=1 Tax=Catenulispora acidiphila (strain DSM 44928 / JCM 14897 / NBRC 102108 / NRRL B-24433 / ID139908) TaxID=479433 RepID=C7Q8Y7_CATAD|nr:serine/threonine-protein kinase [Catenulispora acidiphila]ACU72307.1 serine/threonine protein kinase [Catenulispora acidiphila DSM 44928]
MDVGERYVLGRVIGEGATARVHEAEDTVLRREVAVKVFRDMDIGDSTSGRVDEETRILTRLAHPHLLPVYDSGRDADAHRFIVMPLVRGTTLAKLLAEGPIDPREVKRIGAALAGALAHIHARGIVHRDIKPSNVLLAEDGTPYLADFGFAHAVDGPALTATDCIVGTAGYLAPEQAEGFAVTPAVDIYALGLVLLEALTGEREYQGTPLERATANALRAPRIPARLGPGWLKVLRTMTAKTAAARPTADEVSTLVDAGEDTLPAPTAVGDTMELAETGSRGGLLAGASEPGSADWADWAHGSGAAAASVRAATADAAPARAADVTRRQPRRRLALLGAAACTAAAVVGLGADWLSSGASADTVGPSVTAPGAGAAGPQQSTVPSTGSTSPPSPAGPASSTDPGGSALPASAAHKPPSQSLSAPPPTTPPPTTPAQGPAPTKCPPGGGSKGNGHEKHKCP